MKFLRISPKTWGLIFFLPVALFGISGLTALDIEQVEIDGYFRARGYYLSGENLFPYPDNGKEHVAFQDLFFRNRLTIPAQPSFRIITVIDIGEKFGDNALRLGEASANIIARNAYAEYSVSDNTVFTIGLMPVSLGKGIILAADGAGIQAVQKFFSGRWVNTFTWVNAYDASHTLELESAAATDYREDTIYWYHTAVSPLRNLLFEFFAGGERDTYVTANDYSKDPKKSLLFWSGVSLKYRNGVFLFSGDAFINAGELNLYNTDVFAFQKRTVLAEYYSLESGYDSAASGFGITAAGATGNPADGSAGSSFQDIKASSGFSRIMIDDSGGIALRGYGESPFYGLAALGLYSRFLLFHKLNVQAKVLRFFVAEEGVAGDEFFTEGFIEPSPGLQAFGQFAVLSVGRGAEALSGAQGGNILFDTMMGVRFYY